MTEIIRSLAHYNRGANLALIDTLEKAGPEIAARQTGTYYKTVLATMQHCLWYETAWLKRYKATFDACKALSAPVLDEKYEAMKERAGDDFAMTAAIIRDADAVFEALAAELPDEDFRKIVKFRNFQGEQQERPVWQTMFHVLNHSTHHRGEISGALDAMGVANDYAGFFRYL